MGDFQRCMDLILPEEGGTAHHPQDPGGLTKYGISQRAYPHLDIATLTLEDAKALYRRDYWGKIRGDQLPVGLDLLVLDAAINQGASTAIKLLQEAMGLSRDGIPGPLTLSRASDALPDILLEFCALRAWRYEINPHEDVFGKGWFRRLLRLYGMALKWIA